MSQLRSEVLKQFKNLHRARITIFKGDGRALSEARKQINEGFRKNQDLTDSQEISKLIKFAKEVEVELRKNVVQAVQKEPGVYEVRVTPDTPLLDNVEYKDAVLGIYTGPKCGSSDSVK